MGQDLAAAFRVGDSDRHMCTLDASGVALASIQALYRVTLAQQQEFATLRHQLAALQGKSEQPGA